MRVYYDNKTAINKAAKATDLFRTLRVEGSPQDSHKDILWSNVMSLYSLLNGPKVQTWKVLNRTRRATFNDGTYKIPGTDLNLQACNSCSMGQQ